MPRSVAPLSLLSVFILLAPAAVALAGQQHAHESARSTGSGGHHATPAHPQTPSAVPALPELSAAQVLSGPLPIFPAPSPSPFNAAPSTYVPHKGISPFLRPRRSIVLGAFGSASDTPPEATPSAADRVDTSAAEPVTLQPPDAPPADTPLRDAAQTVSPAKSPVTLYVISGCYAGDRPPADGMLPAGCDVAKMRAVRIK